MKIRFIAPWFGLFWVTMVVGSVFIVPLQFYGDFGIALATVLSAPAQWAFLRRHGVSAWWIGLSIASLPLLAGAVWGAWRIGVPLFYSDPLRFEPGEPSRPLWTWGWWTIGMAICGLLLGALQSLLLKRHLSRAWLWPLVSAVAWGCLGAVKTEPWSRSPWVGLIVGPLVWAAVEILGLMLLAGAHAPRAKSLGFRYQT